MIHPLTKDGTKMDARPSVLVVSLQTTVAAADKYDRNPSGETPIQTRSLKKLLNTAVGFDRITSIPCPIHGKEWT